jgi:glycosyltransferase involved in cell wall biosynthesis
MPGPQVAPGPPAIIHCRLLRRNFKRRTDSTDRPADLHLERYLPCFHQVSSRALKLARMQFPSDCQSTGRSGVLSDTQCKVLSEEPKDVDLCLRETLPRRMADKLRIAIDCRITDARQGVGTAVLGLAKALSESETTDQEYTFIVREALKGWLEPYVYGPCRLEGIPEPKFSRVKAALRRFAPLRYIWGRLRDRVAPVPVSDGFIESRRFDLVHFPTQAAYLTDIPSIYQPWDLQHLHYREFFSKAEFVQRERGYRAFCGQAASVCVQAKWTKWDIIEQYKIPEEKIAVIPWGSVFDAYKAPSEEQIQATTEKYGLSGMFFFYPAVTWPHKNHEVIIRALSILKKDRGIAPHVFFSGSSTVHRSTLDKLAQGLGITDQLHFLGFVTPEELQAIFSTATAMVFPSKFEGFGLPILEAFHAGLPVLSSNATTLPEVARDGACYFDPDSPAELSTLMWAVLDQPKLRQDMIQRGTAVHSQYSIKDTAAMFQTLYAKTAALSLENRQLTSASAVI